MKKWGRWWSRETTKQWIDEEEGENRPTAERVAVNTFGGGEEMAVSRWWNS